MGIELITKNGNITLTKPTGTGGATVDLSNYYTKEQIDAMLEEVDGDIEQLFNMLEVDYATIELVEEKIAAIPAPDLTNYLTKSELEDKGYITGIPDEYITESELSSKGFQTSDDVVDAIDYYCHDYVTKDYVDDAIANIPAPDLNNYATKDDIPDVSAYQTEEQVIALIKEHGGGTLPASEEGEF